MRPLTALERQTRVIDSVGNRVTDMKTIYESTSLEETFKLLRKYGVRYIFIGTLERQKYPSLSLDKFNLIGKPVYNKNNVQIIEVAG